MRLGLVGGTFDPVHIGHLMMAEVALQELSLDRVVFIPAGDPPHKGEEVTAAEDRYAMVLLATAANDAFIVSRRELDRSGPSYSLATVREFRQELGEGGELFFITGADAILEVRTWHRWQELLRECRFAAVTRPGFDLSRLREVLPAELLARVDILPKLELDVSSTQVRERIRLGEAVRYLVPELVDVYIRKRNLYRR